VSVIGLGNMGSTLARALLEAGHGVTVWNRSTEKAVALSDAGAKVAADAAEAVCASPVTIACVARYEHLYESLGNISADVLRGRTLVNLTWGTPDDARAMERWINARSGGYLDGGIPVYPSGIGRAETELIYAGPRELWDRHAPTLRGLGGASRLVGEEIGAANVVALAIPGGFYHLCYGAFFEAVAYAASEGVPVAELSSQIESAFGMLTSSLADAVDAITHERFDTDQATLGIQLDAMLMARDAALRRGQRATLLDALVEVFERGVAAGHEDSGSAAITSMLRDGG
jgi:3-hydroxyisobutyrate dehydrogenase-like beta-hydroxyacid dehydrogenase